LKSSLFVKLFMSEEARDRWLSSAVRFIKDCDDWGEMNPTAARECDGWAAAPGAEDFMSVREFLDNIADFSRYFESWYDEEEGAFFAADARHKSAMRDIASSVAALRGASAFVDDPRPGFIYVFPASSGGDPEALMRITSGESRFLPPSDASPETLYFVSEAEERIDEMLES
jgi:hypothetical protein